MGTDHGCCPFCEEIMTETKMRTVSRNITVLRMAGRKVALPPFAKKTNILIFCYISGQDISFGTCLKVVSSML